MVRLTNEQATRKYRNRLHIAALAVIDEGDKVRVIHDGSNHVMVNNRIRPRDQLRSPGAGELRALLREKRETGRPLWALAGDVAKAHRRVKIREADWGYQACRIDPDHVWVKCVGTDGVASAAYYWSRAAAAIVVRAAH